MTAVDLRLCGIADLDIEDESVDAVITDPPYPREFLPLWGDLGAFAARVLKPGGVLIGMSGHMFLPDVLNLVAAGGLTYRWSIACMTPGANGRIFPRKVYQGSKPIVWWSNDNGGTASANRWIEDRIVSKPDKRFHGWGQDLGVFEKLVRDFSSRGDLVCDPFLGGGTTAVAAVLNGRRFVGCDIDEACIRKTTERVRAAEEYMSTHRAELLAR